MEWDFTPEQVVKGAVGYTLEDFRGDLLQEVRLNLDLEEGELQVCFDLIYDLFYWLATGRSFEQFLETVEGDGILSGSFLALVRDQSAANIEMLGAILQRMIVHRIEAGMSLEEAVTAAYAYHEAIVSGYSPEA